MQSCWCFFLGGQKKVGFFGVVVNICEIKFTKKKECETIWKIRPDHFFEIRWSLHFLIFGKIQFKLSEPIDIVSCKKKRVKTPKKQNVDFEYVNDLNWKKKMRKLFFFNSNFYCSLLVSITSCSEFHEYLKVSLSKKKEVQVSLKIA